MTVDEFRAAGERLFGDGWQRQLAEYFDMRHDRVRQWASGKEPIPPWMRTELCGVRMLLLLPKIIDVLRHGPGGTDAVLLLNSLLDVKDDLDR
jgi:hypothetical protein